MENSSATSGITLQKKIFFIISSVLFLAIFILTASEIILRFKGVRRWQVHDFPIKVEPREKLFVKNATLGYANLPGRFTVTLPDGYAFRVTNLPDGRRATHPLSTHGKDRPKDEIWIFGCSFTYGHSLNDQETFPWLLQERLPEYEVVNFGVSGYGTVQALIQLREALARGRVPKVALLNFASMHEERNIFSRNWQKVIINLKNFGQVFYPYARLDEQGQLYYQLGEVKYYPFPLVRYSALMNVIEEKYNNLQEQYYRIGDVTRALLLEFANSAKKEHIPVVIAGITLSQPTRDMLAFVREHGFKAVDISVDLTLKENTNYPHDSHPGPLANKKYADKLEAFLRAEVLK
jgi:hypothetical protein